MEVKKMASSGKKGKKSKGTVISLQSFLSKGDAPIGTTHVAKKIRNIEGEDGEYERDSIPLFYQLPTAPRAKRIFDDDSIPHKPPFVAYMTNLPFDISEDDLHEYFTDYKVVSIRLPRDDGNTGRVRGFGYVEFETRDDIIQALSLPDPTIKGRRIRIDFSNDERGGRNQRGGGGNRRGYDNLSSNHEHTESTNWRRKEQLPDSTSSSNHSNRDYGRNRNHITSNHHNNNDSSSSWRSGERNLPKDLLIERKPSEERPKLNIKPRTLPIRELDIAQAKTDDNNKPPNSTTSLPSKNIFGSAKPVDTTARDLEIEQRLAESRRLDMAAEEEKLANKIEKIDIAQNSGSAKTTDSWRRKDQLIDDDSDSKSRKAFRAGPNRRQMDSNRSNERLDQSKPPKARDGNKPRDDYKKLDNRSQQSVNNHSDFVLNSSNKYSGLEDEVSE